MALGNVHMMLVKSTVGGLITHMNGKMGKSIATQRGIFSTDFHGKSSASIIR